MNKELNHPLEKAEPKTEVTDRVIKEMWKLTEWEEECVREGIKLYKSFMKPEIEQAKKEEREKWIRLLLWKTKNLKEKKRRHDNRLRRLREGSPEKKTSKDNLHKQIVKLQYTIRCLERLLHKERTEREELSGLRKEHRKQLEKKEKT